MLFGHWAPLCLSYNSTYGDSIRPWSRAPVQNLICWWCPAKFMLVGLAPGTLSINKSGAPRPTKQHVFLQGHSKTPQLYLDGRHQRVEITKVDIANQQKTGSVTNKRYGCLWVSQKEDTVCAGHGHGHSGMPEGIAFCNIGMTTLQVGSNISNIHVLSLIHI